MPSICQQQLAELSKKIHPYLKGMGFKKHGNNYNRLVSNSERTAEFTQVINYQLSQWNHAKSCQFTINLGVWVHLIHPNQRLSVVHEYLCDFRTRVGILEHGTDTWYELLEDTNSLAKDLRQFIQMYAIPWLDAYASYEGIVARWDSLDPDLQLSQFGTARTMIAFFLATQQIDRARHIIEQQYSYNLERFPRGSEIMLELAASLGFSLNSS